MRAIVPTILTREREQLIVGGAHATVAPGIGNAHIVVRGAALPANATRVGAEGDAANYQFLADSLAALDLQPSHPPVRERAEQAAQAVAKWTNGGTLEMA